MTTSISMLIDEFISSKPTRKTPPDFLAIKSGFLPLKVGYNQNPEPNQAHPTIQLNI